MNKNFHFEFSDNLIKGRIAEIVFEQMLREAGGFTVLHFGYENIIPELTMRGSKNSPAMEIIRRSPDFAVINQETKEVRLIEVKYQHSLNERYTFDAALKMSKAWNPSYLFIATKKGFFFDAIDAVISCRGKISPLRHPSISQEIQEKYLALLCKYEP